MLLLFWVQCLHKFEAWKNLGFVLLALPRLLLLLLPRGDVPTARCQSGDDKRDKHLWVTWGHKESFLDEHEKPSSAREYSTNTSGTRSKQARSSASMHVPASPLSHVSSPPRALYAPGIQSEACFQSWSAKFLANIWSMSLRMSKVLRSKKFPDITFGPQITKTNHTQTACPQSLEGALGAVNGLRPRSL